MRSGGKKRKKKGESAAARAIAESLMAGAPAPVPVREGARLASRYTVRREIAHGGMGTVLEAWDEAIGRPVALKVVRLGGDVPPDVRERFLHEAEVTGRLEHPNIVPVHDLGEWPDPETGARQAFFCMKLIEGEDLRSVLKRRGDGAFTRVRLLQIFQDVCMAVAYAHDRGVVHRDLKPGNVMVGKFGETLVVDWGLAKARGLGTAGERAYAARVAGLPGEADRSRLTMDGQIIGTPGYMAPEQAAGRLEEVDERSDVFALGVMLREILGDEPPPDLARVVARATESDRAARYGSARDLHDEVQLHIEGVRERDRRRAMAVAKSVEGTARAAALPRLRAALEKATGEAKALRAAIRASTPLEEKRKAWAAQDRCGELRKDLLDAFTAAHGSFTSALGIDAGCAVARAGLAALYWDRFLEAERASDPDQMRLNRGLLEQVDAAAYAERLRGDGTLAVRARRFACGCLRAKGQHSAACAPVPLEGAHVFLYCWVERDRRLVPARPDGVAAAPAPAAMPEAPGLDLREAAYLGVAPLSGLRIPMGRYLLVLAAPGRAATRVPLLVKRLSAESVDVTLFEPGEIPEGFVHVPAGRVAIGGDSVAEQDEAVVFDIPDFFMARAPVTAAEWLEFVNDLAATDPAAAEAHAPRADADLAVQWVRTPDGRYALPPPSEKKTWHPREPVSGLAWASAMAYAEWRSRRENRRFTLPDDEEWEKAARGVDGRRYPWGDWHDPAFCNSREAFEGAPRLVPVGSFPVDESPYGVIDLAGNAATWCRNGVRGVGEGWRALRGGSCMNSGALIRAAYRFGLRPHIIRPYVGVRLVMHPVPPREV